MTTAPTGSVLESPVLIDAGGDRLFGILAGPNDASVAVLLVQGGWYGTSMGPNRMLLRLERRLADRGCMSLRFDYHGVGESTGTIDRFYLDAPHIEDVEAAVRWLHGRGVERVVIVGVCVGGLAALGCAASDPTVVGVALVSGALGGQMSRKTQRELMKRQTPLHRLLRYGIRPWALAGLFDPVRRRRYAKILRVRWRAATGRIPIRETPAVGLDPSGPGRPFLDAIKQIVERGVDLLFVYGEKDKDFERFEEARTGRLGELIERGGSRVELTVLPGDVHAFDSIESQQAVIQRIVDWVVPRTTRTSWVEGVGTSSPAGA